MEPRRVLLVCTHNSARSQMAEAMLRTWGAGRFTAFSAGTAPGEVRPEAIAVMSEIGIDISGQRTKLLGEFAGEDFDWLITVCDRARQHCANIPGIGAPEHWAVEDPSEDEGDEAHRLETFRRVRDDLQGRIHMFILAGGRPDLSPPGAHVPEQLAVG